MATTSRYYDGDYAVGFYDGPPLITYPFLNNTTPDRYAKQIRRTWLQRGVDYVPTNADRTSYTNLIQYSEQFENVIWTKNQLTVSENQTTNPYDGALSVDAIYETATTDVHFVYQPYTFAAATYTVSVIAKANGRNWLYINTPMASAAFFNLSTGVVGTIISATSAEMIPLGNGFYRCSLTFTAASGADFVRYYVSTDGSTISYAGDITKGLYLWGSELKQSSSAGPYVSTTNATRTVLSPDLDPGDEINEADPFAYLVAEAEQNRDIADTVKVSRLFSRIPATQTRPTSLRISKPSVPGVVEFGDFRLNKPDAQLEIYDAYAAQTVASDSGAPSLYPTGGTYTLTFDGDTTASIPYNHNAAQVETELDALASVSARGGCSVTGSYNSVGGFTVSFNSYAAATMTLSSLTPTPPTGNSVTTLSSGFVQTAFASGGSVSGGTFTITIFTQTTAAITFSSNLVTLAANISSALNALSGVTNRGGVVVSGMTSSSSGGFVNYFGFTLTFENPAITGTSSLTPVPSVISISSGDLGIVQTIRPQASAQRVLNIPAHGITDSDTLYIYNATTYYYDIVSFSVLDADNISLDIDSTMAYAASATITEAGKRTKANYAPGSGTIRASAVTSFYLPGVTAGIDTAADIPQAQDQGDQTPFLLATFAGTGTINMNVGQLQPWNGTTILSQEITTINAADV